MIDQMIKSDINNAEIVLMSLNKTRSLIVVGSGPEKEGFNRKIQKQQSQQNRGKSQASHEVEGTFAVQIDLRSTLAKCLKVPVQIQVFYWLYALHSICAAFETVVRVPLDLLLSIKNVFLPILGRPRMRHTSLFACLIILGYYFVTQDFYFLDVSVLYHSFRGQSYVKLYGAGLALQLSQKLFTMGGRFLLGKLSRILRDSNISSFTMGLQVLVCLIYCVSHFMSLYLDFILYTIILNSSSHNVLMFYFVVNLAKMKVSILKKFQKNAFKGTLVYDAKDRFLKLTYSILFLLTINQSRSLESLTRMGLVTVFCSIIDYLRHMATLTMASEQEYILKIQQMLTRQLYWVQPDIKVSKSTSISSEKSIIEKSSVSVGSQEEVVVRSSEWDFTVIPYVLLLLKFFNIIVWTNNKGEFFNELILQTYIVLGIIVCIISPFLKKLVKKLNPLHKPLPFPLLHSPELIEI